MSNNEDSHTAGSYHAVSCSGGKDSTAMLLLMIERDKPAKSLADHIKEQQEKSHQKKRKPRDDRER